MADILIIGSQSASLEEAEQSLGGTTEVYTVTTALVAGDYMTPLKNGDYSLVVVCRDTAPYTVARNIEVNPEIDVPILAIMAPSVRAIPRYVTSITTLDELEHDSEELLDPQRGAPPGGRRWFP